MRLAARSSIRIPLRRPWGRLEIHAEGHRRTLNGIAGAATRQLGRDMRLSVQARSSICRAAACGADGKSAGRSPTGPGTEGPAIGNDRIFLTTGGTPIRTAFAPSGSPRYGTQSSTREAVSRISRVAFLADAREPELNFPERLRMCLTPPIVIA